MARTAAEDRSDMLTLRLIAARSAASGPPPALATAHTTPGAAPVNINDKRSKAAGRHRRLRLFNRAAQEPDAEPTRVNKRRIDIVARDPGGRSAHR
ncbi:hypothetical protein GCM10027610_057920 [Dactylosporangium cerinum]